MAHSVMNRAFLNVFSNFCLFFLVKFYSVIILTLFLAGSDITLPGRYGQIFPSSILSYTNPPYGLLVLMIYSQMNVLIFCLLYISKTIIYVIKLLLLQALIWKLFMKLIFDLWHCGQNPHLPEIRLGSKLIHTLSKHP